jgi:D-glycero-alpha-D-manno-heptose-7-phosphate kinase
MIITKTPCRLSFAGGGTDLYDYYNRDYGAVISTSIDKYVYVAVNKKFDDNVRVSYSETENVETAHLLKHGVIREALKFANVKKKIEVVTVSDIPGKGTGLGSSSALAVGTLNALYAMKGVYINKERLAREACHLEIDLLQQPIGKQDQYSATYGGLNYIRFQNTGAVLVEPLSLKARQYEELQNNLIYFYTGVTRSSADILTEQKANIEKRVKILDDMRDSVEDMRYALKMSDFTEFGLIMDRGWENKKKLATMVTDTIIDHYYNEAKKAGAIGGKINGAGGGGFFTFYCEPRKQDAVRETLNTLKEVDIKFSSEGSRVVCSE